jgi:aarF domain-containing kinase
LNAAARNNTSSKRTRAIQLAAAGGTVGVALFAFWDDIKHTYAAAERTGRVVTALAICINE